MKKSIVLCALATLLAACSLTPVASRVPGYLTTPKGQLLTDADGRCWRTAEWRPALAIPECDPEVVRAREEAAVAEAEKEKEKEKAKDDKKTDETAPEAVAEAGVDADADAEAAPALVAAPATSAPLAALGVSGALGEGRPAPAPRFRDEVVFEPLVLNSDASFFFGDDHLTPEGRSAVIEIAGLLKARRVQDLRITVVGHTDRIGSDSANLALSRRRAAAVKTALVAEGIPAASIETAGLGAAKPVTDREQCPDRLVKCELIACLRPDRRVEIRTRGRLPSGTRQVPVEGRLEWPRPLPRAAAQPRAPAVCRAS